MDCCAGHSESHQDHTNKTDSQGKKIPWLSAIMILLIIGLVVFSILK